MYKHFKLRNLPLHEGSLQALDDSASLIWSNFFQRMSLGQGDRGCKLKIKFELSLVQSVSLLILKIVCTLKTMYTVVFSCEEVAMISSFKNFTDRKN